MAKSKEPEVPEVNWKALDAGLVRAISYPRDSAKELMALLKHLSDSSGGGTAPDLSAIEKRMSKLEDAVANIAKSLKPTAAPKPKPSSSEI